MRTFKISNPFKLLLLTFAMSVFFSSCSQSRFTSEQQAKIKELMGKKLAFPDDLTLYSIKDQKEFPGLKLSDEKAFRFVSYIDASCGTCITELTKWDSLINNQNNENLEYLFILKSYDDFEIFKFMTQDVNYQNVQTVILDKRETFYQENDIPYDKALQSYLINSDNEIIGVGNPVFSESIMDSYLKLMSD